MNLQIALITWNFLSIPSQMHFPTHAPPPCLTSWLLWPSGNHTGLLEHHPSTSLGPWLPAAENSYFLMSMLVQYSTGTETLLYLCLTNYHFHLQTLHLYKIKHTKAKPKSLNLFLHFFLQSTSCVVRIIFDQLDESWWEDYLKRKLWKQKAYLYST